MKPEKKKVGKSHNHTGKLGKLPWRYCTRCGLVHLKNEATERAAKMPCEDDL